MKVHCHVHETEKEVNDALASEMFGRERPITRLQRLGLFDSRLIAVHMTQVQLDYATTYMRLVTATHITYFLVNGGGD